MANRTIILVAIVAAIVVIAGIGAVFMTNDKGSDETPDSRTFVDLAGNEVTVPGEINRIVVTGMHPVVPVYTYYADGPDKLVGVGSPGLQYAKSGILGKIYPGLDSIETVFPTGTDTNAETVLGLNPDVVFYTAETKSDYTMITNVGLPAVGFQTAMGDNSKDGLNVFNHLELWLKQMEEVFGDNGRADSLISYNNDVQDEIAEKIADVNESEKPKVLIIFSYTSTSLLVAGSNHYSEYWIEASGGVNAAADVDGIAQVNMERVLEWNPDVIYFANGGTATPDDLYNNKVGGHDWSSVNAVKNRKVLTFPSATYMSYAPSLEAGLVLQWMAKNNLPDLFSDLDLSEAVSDYFMKFFGYTASSEDIVDFLAGRPITVH
ncbi:MAG: ABC transporter substrate-binding protein [Candidatus Methanoplasma sp.]|jgi:iron complex transport system substrate-binding protein|nr:ABC transporter substrate-binding protein [Candidatus Methanoplasma sp.]